jgi:hypothetical protein
MIITLDDPLTIAKHPDSRQPAGQYGTLLGGLHTSPALITHEGRQASSWPSARWVPARFSACQPVS